MSLFDRPILIFSNFCIHSKNFLQILIKHKELYDTFIRLNVDVNPQTKMRPQPFYRIQDELGQKITSVPTLIISEQTDQGIQVFVLSDKEAFKWLDFKTKSKQIDECVGFCSNEMGSFSDGYSKFGSTDLCDATEQNFKFFEQGSRGERILTGEKFNIHGNINDLKPEMFLEPSTDNDSAKLNAMYNNMEKERQTSQTSQNSQTRQGIMGNRDLSSISGNSQQKVNNTDFNERLNKYKQDSGQLKGNTTQRQQIDFTTSNFGLSAKLGSNGGNSGSIKQNELDTRLQQLMQDRESF